MTTKTGLKLKGGLVAIIDEEDFGKVSKYNWFAHKEKNNTYVYANTILNGKRTCIKMHRIIMGANTGQMIDHIDRNGLNNKKENLRFSNKSLNSFNSRVRRDNKAGIKGVFYDKIREKFVGTVKINYKSFQKRFDTKEQALNFREELLKKHNICV